MNLPYLQGLDEVFGFDPFAYGVKANAEASISPESSLFSRG